MAIIKTNVPSLTYSAAGFVAPIESAILSGVQADIDAALGGGVNPALNTPQGQIAVSETAIINSANSAFVFMTQMMDPAYSFGRWQDGIGRIYFMTRLPALPTTLQCACVGAQGREIPINSLIEDTSGNTYYCQETVKIPVSGTVTATFVNLAVGPIAVPNSGDVSIVTALPGWDSVTVTSGTIGQNEETRSAFELRRQESVAGNSKGPVGAIIGAVSQVTGVLDYWGKSNNTNSPVTYLGVTIPAYGMWITVSGGTQADVASAIFSKLNPGPPMGGNTTVTTYDNNPLLPSPVPYSVTFEIPAGLRLLFAINIVNNSGIPADAVAQIQQAILNASAGEVVGCPRARIGSLVLANNYISAILALGSWAQVRSIFIGSNNVSSATFTGSISGATLTVSAVATGTIAIGQTLSGAKGDIPAGTTILSGSGTTWTISATLGTIASEAMTTSVAASTSVQVQADQAPEVVLADVAVTIS